MRDTAIQQLDNTGQVAFTHAQIAGEPSSIYIMREGSVVEWGDAASIFSTSLVNSGRLSLSATESIPLTDIVDAESVHFLPDTGALISLYNSVIGRWKIYNFEATSISLAGTNANSNYDIFISENAAQIELSLVAWADDTTRDVPLTLQDKIWVRTGNPKERYLGTLRTTVAGRSEDSQSRRFLWNLYNQSERTIRALIPVTEYTNATLNYVPAAGNTTPGEGRIEFVCGNPSFTFFQWLASAYANGPSSNTAIMPQQNSYAALGLDSIEQPFGTAGALGRNTGVTGIIPCVVSSVIPAGFHFLQKLVKSQYETPASIYAGEFIDPDSPNGNLYVVAAATGYIKG